VNPTFIIARKRDGHELADREIADFVEGYVGGSIPDYQMSALAMAIFLQGMTAAETTELTRQMLASGITLNWPHDGIARVDKHSTGGIGDKISLILAPLLACCGFQVPMISGRGLGATGGTLDKLEAIPGFRTDLTVAQMKSITEQVGCVISSASAELAPADKKLYALRDVTATVPSIPLITGSIMSKKLAEGLDALVLDVKFGTGAFMKTLDQAGELAQSLVDVGKRMGLPTAALLTDMNQPLGRMVGNGVEVIEAVETLTGNGPEDLTELTLALGGELMTLAGKADSRQAGVLALQAHLDNGNALAKYQQMVSSQGGDPEASLSIAKQSVVTANRSGYLVGVNAEQLGQAIITMGGGRRVMSDPIDHAVGFETLARIGDEIEANQPLVRLFSHDHSRDEATKIIQQAFQIDDEPARPIDLIHEALR